MICFEVVVDVDGKCKSRTLKVNNGSGLELGLPLLRKEPPEDYDFLDDMY